jgi:hypothetical protein
MQILEMWHLLQRSDRDTASLVEMPYLLRRCNPGPKLDKVVFHKDMQILEMWHLFQRSDRDTASLVKMLYLPKEMQPWAKIEKSCFS